MQRFHSEIVAMLLSVWTKWEHFLLPVCIWILGGQWKVILPSIFIWKVNFLYLQLVSHIGSHQKRIWKVDLKQQVKFKSSLLLELLHRISVFPIVHETKDSTVCSYGRGRAGCSQVLLCQGLWQCGNRGARSDIPRRWLETAKHKSVGETLCFASLIGFTLREM